MSGRHLRRGIGRGIANCIKYLFAPGLCLACGCELGGGDSLCHSCAGQLRQVPNPCHYCGQPNPVEAPICPACLLNPPRWQKLVAPLQYRGLARDYLLQLKFSEAPYLARTLCRHSAAPFRRNESWPEVLLPVPLHRSRLFERGYNQADEIASLWSQMSGIPADRGALTRLRATASQSGLSASQRSDNVHGAFAYAPAIEYRHVAIVDDIVTTGSTATEISKTLHRGGVEFVEVWALARVYRR